MPRVSSLLVLLFSLVVLSLAGCSSGGSDGCGTNADCAGGRMCAPDGSCVQCLANDHCSAGQLCCQGGCYDDDDVEARCGCEPSPTGSAGERCGETTNICVVDGVRATAANVADGVCGCSCDAASGGTLCTLDSEGAVACTCDRSDPAGTCELPALDANGNPHIVADTCSPQGTCVCFAEGPAACDPSGATPDCTSAGCVNALNDVDNCGVGGRVCTDPATGIADTGTCRSGGCSCDEPTDCQGPGLNVNECVVVVGGPQCVCDDYFIEESVKGACPLGLPCVEGGCSLEGVAYGTRTDLLRALGVFP